MALPKGLPKYTLGWEAIEWAHEMLSQPDDYGGTKGNPWRYKPDQMHFILWFYAVDAEGNWVYRRAYRERAKGTGKSPMVAAIACTEFLGPTKFSHFKCIHGNYTTAHCADSKAVGKENPDAIIWLAAISLGGTDHTYEYVQKMLDGPAEKYYNLDIGITRILLRGVKGSKSIKQITASPKSHEGPKPTFVIAEETQMWTPAEHGPQLMATIHRGLMKTKGRRIEVTNAPAPGEGTVAEATHRFFEDIEAGLALDEGLLFDTFAIRVDDIYDREQALPALAKMYENAPWIDINRTFGDICDPSHSEVDSRRFFFNEIVPPNAMWIDTKTWDAAKRDISLGKSDKIALGFRIKKQAAAVVACRLKDKAVFLVKMWEKPTNADRTWEVPYAEIDTKVRSILEKHNAVHMVASPENFQDIVGRWSIDYESSAVIEELWLSRNKQRHADAVEQFESAVSDQRLIHPGDSALSRHVMNCFKEEVPQGFLLRQETPYSHRYIVAAEAAVLAMQAAQEAIEDGGLREPSGGFYVW